MGFSVQVSAPFVMLEAQKGQRWRSADHGKRFMLLICSIHEQWSCDARRLTCHYNWQCCRQRLPWQRPWACLQVLKVLRSKGKGIQAAARELAEGTDPRRARRALLVVQELHALTPWES